MFNRRFFLQSAPAAFFLSAALALPQMARANIGGLVQEIDKFCAKVEDMADLASIDLVNVPLIQSTLAAASRSSIAAGIALLEMDGTGLSSDERNQLRAATRRFQNCRNEYLSLKIRLLEKIRDAVGGTGGVIVSPQLERLLQREENQMANVNRVIQQILNQENDENK